MVVKHFNKQNPKFATIKSASLGTLSVPCLFSEMNGKRLVVETEAAVSSCTAVTVEYDDAMFLGEVIACVQNAGVFVIEIKVEQVLSGLQSLMALRSQLLGETSAKMHRVSPVTSHLHQAVA